VRETIKQGEGDGPMDAATKGGEMRPGRRPGGAAVGFCAPRSPSGRRSFPLLSLVLLALLVLLFPGATAAQYLLVPMDRSQANHLRAYGLTYSVLEGGEEAEWLLNYRGGSFLLPDRERVRREAALRGVSFQPVDGGEVARIRGIIQNGNMDAVPLETAPRIAVYTPPNTPPWDDAVTLALEYAGIPYATVWDGDVLEGACPSTTGSTSTTRTSPASTPSSSSPIPGPPGSRRRWPGTRRWPGASGIPTSPP
jgi:hypothetical protein